MGVENRPQRTITAKEARRRAQLEAFLEDVRRSKEATLAEVRAGITLEDSTIPAAIDYVQAKARRKADQRKRTDDFLNNRVRLRAISYT